MASRERRVRGRQMSDDSVKRYDRGRIAEGLCATVAGQDLPQSVRLAWRLGDFWDYVS